MKLKDYRNHFIEKLTPLYDGDEAARFFYITLEELKGWRRTDFALNPEAELNKVEIHEWDNVLAQLENYRPIQYIFNKAHFYGLEFHVNENTLIPRPETEELAEWIITDNQEKEGIRILDIGTGSGCIAITLAKNLPKSQVHAIDISENALETAHDNAVQNNAAVAFRQMDILTATALPQRFDVIVSNPPYVRNLEKAEIQNNVLQHEPHLALFVDDNDPLIFYRKIAQLALYYLNPGGSLYFEINQYLGTEMVHMLKETGFTNIILRKDFMGNNRMVKVSLQS